MMNHNEILNEYERTLSDAMLTAAILHWGAILHRLVAMPEYDRTRFGVALWRGQISLTYDGTPAWELSTDSPHYSKLIEIDLEIDGSPWATALVGMHS